VGFAPNEPGQVRRCGTNDIREAILQVWDYAQRLERFQAKHAHGLDPGADADSHSNQVYADCVDLSAVENASKQESRASVLIQPEPIML
jgi:hypothetical protein